MRNDSFDDNSKMSLIEEFQQEPSQSQMDTSTFSIDNKHDEKELH
jgi:hypothetical protein